jgi:hypothetical protein
MFLSVQQVRQVPIFLGRKKRSIQGSDEPGIPEKPQTFESSSGDKVLEEGYINSTDVPEPTTQVIEFTINGQHERFIVAQEVKVDVYPQDPIYDDYSLGPDSTNLMDSVSVIEEKGSRSGYGDKRDNDLR